MSRPLPHIIKHVQVDLNVNGMSRGVEIQQEAKEWVNHFLQSIESDLDSLAETGQYIFLDHLELDIQAYGTDWKESALLQAKEKIMDALLKVKREESGGIHTDIKSRKQHFSEIFLFFIKNGYLPWQATEGLYENWQENVQAVFKEGEPAFMMALLEIIQKNPDLSFRLLQQISFETFLKSWTKILSRFPPETYDIFEDISGLNRLIESGKISQKTIEALRVYLIEILVGKEVETSRHSFSRLINKAAKKDLSLLKRQIESYSFQSKKMNTGFGEIIRILQQATLIKDISETEKNRAVAKLPEEVKIMADKKNNDPQIKKMKGEARNTQSVYINNAGLVILNPFIKRLFEKVGFWKEEHWVNQDAAVILLNYLVSGEEAVPEFHLAFPKILCGMEPDQPIDFDLFKMTPEIEQEAASLLQSVVEHWSALGNTTIQGLRESFLLRPGRLEESEHNWNLTVEQRAYDMLLTQLPWNIQMVKYTWMKKLLITEWDS